MRRSEFKVEDKEQIKSILDEVEHGVLSLICENAPYSVPLNFVYFEDSIYFHGAKSGKKIEVIKKSPKASFVAVVPYSLVPSYFSDEKSACPATQFFASVNASGDVSLVESLDKKAKVLNALMEKLQIDGGYEKISVDNPIYKNSLKSTAVLALKIENISCKIKLGQNLNDERFMDIIGKFEKRGSPKDTKTVKLMKHIRYNLNKKDTT